MVFDRISLVRSYAALKIVELNDGAVKDILFNKTAYYGTKTILRFKTLADLAAFINENYPYQYFDPNCQCAVTSKDAIWTPLSFNLTLPKGRYASFVNNLRGDFESAQEKRLNSMSVRACQSIFKTNSELVRLKGEYSCFGYVVNQQQYVSPCEYVELITNAAYRRLVEVLYPTAQHPDLPAFQLLDNVTEETIATVPIPELIVCLPITVDGYYPLYTTQLCAEQHQGGNGGYHSHDLGNPVTTYYMPNGLNMDPNNGNVTQWHGNYVTTTTTAAPTTTTTTTTLVPLAPNGGGQACQAIDVDGYYPLYTTITCAETHVGGNGGYHSHDLGNPVTTYYMPNGLNQDPNNGTITQWHGTYGQITTTTTTSTTTQPPIQVPGPPGGGYSGGGYYN